MSLTWVLPVRSFRLELRVQRPKPAPALPAREAQKLGKLVAIVKNKKGRESRLFFTIVFIPLGQWRLSEALPSFLSDNRRILRLVWLSAFLVKRQPRRTEGRHPYGDVLCVVMDTSPNEGVHGWRS